jgi:hypothetical protein
MVARLFISVLGVTALGATVCRLTELAMMSFDPGNNTARLLKEAQELEANGRILEALCTREKLLMTLQKLHGDRTPETDEQKLRFAELTLRWAQTPGATKSEEAAVAAAVAKRAHSRLNHALSASKDPSALTAAQQKKLTAPEKARPKSAIESRHKHCRNADEHEADDSLAAIATAAVLKPSALGPIGDRPRLFQFLSLPSCLAVAEELLSESSLMPEAQDQVNVVQLRGRLLMAQVAHFHQAKRPRAAVPLLAKAIHHLTRAAKLNAASRGGEPCSVELAQSYLTLCVLQSSANHHHDALRAAHAALSMTLLVEESLWLLDPLREEALAKQAEVEAAKRITASGASDSHVAGRPPRPSSAAASRRAGGARRSPNATPTKTHLDASGTRAAAATDDREHAAPAASSLEPERMTIYCGPLQAACYHNLGVEQEHLGMGELALESFQTGFELAYLTLGESDALTLRLQQCYAELFTSLNCRHFGSAETMQRSSVVRAMSDPRRALSQLRASYEASMRHHATLQAEGTRQRRLLQTPDPTSSQNRSRPASAASRRSRPSSALSRRSQPMQ